jgi:hypothetical protein
MPEGDSAPRPSFLPVRRIVTGHDKSAKAVVLFDGEATNHRKGSLHRATLISATKETPQISW